MDWKKAFPDFDPRWILRDTGALIFIDKPPFIASQFADTSVSDDLPSRLAAWLRSQGKPDYLGVHQRLDKDTSGVVAYVRDFDQNKRIAAEFENRRVDKTYLACVERWRSDKKLTLRDDLVEGKGRMEVGRKGNGKLAITHVRLVERRGARALLELELETGRTHQARVQLAHAGSPIAGDALYGGPRAGRLMLHASALEVAGESAKSPMPKAFRRWLDGVEDPIEECLEWAFTKRWGLARRVPHTDCFRLVHETEIDALAVDVFAGYFVVHFYERGTSWTDARRKLVIDALAKLEPDGIYVKTRSKDASATTTELVFGSAAPSPLVVREKEHEYLVRLEQPAVGLYLDQRRNRARVEEASAGRRILNLFAYTCAFTVAAIAGGARESVSVDSSASALERGRENVLRAGGDPKLHTFACDDAATWLARAAKKNERFDLVILDPPSFGRAGSRSFSIDRDYGALVRASIAVLAPKGILVACTNHRQTSLGKLRKVVREAADHEKRRALQLKDLSMSADFPGDPTMKSVWLRVL